MLPTREEEDGAPARDLRVPAPGAQVELRETVVGHVAQPQVLAQPVPARPPRQVVEGELGAQPVGITLADEED